MLVRRQKRLRPEYIEAGKQALFYILQNMSNRGVNLWLLENYLCGAVTAQQQLILPPGTIDVRESNWVYIINSEAAEYLPTANPDSPAAFDQNLDIPATSTIGANFLVLSTKMPSQSFMSALMATRLVVVLRLTTLRMKLVMTV